MIKKGTGCRLKGCCLAFQPAASQLIVLLLVFLVACQPRRTVTLALLGDINLGRGVSPSAGSFDFLKVDLARADLTLANLESPLAASLPADSLPYNLCASSDRAGLLNEWGFDLLSIANNHNFDCGLNGASGTRSALESVGVTPVGPGTEAVYREVNGLRLAFLAFDDITSTLDADAAVQAIRLAHESGALVIVSVHWGMEYQGGASNRQKILARQFASAGAALVWGHHPHVLQPVEWVGDEPCEGSKPSQGCALVLYSLGNALFDQGGLADTRQSALALVQVNAKGVQSIQVVPFVIDLTDSRLAAPDAETARKILGRLKIK